MGIGYDLGGGISTEINVGESGIRFPYIPSAVAPSEESPDTIYISPWMYDLAPQGTWAIFVDGTIVRNSGIDNTGSLNDGDEVLYKDYVPAGTYTVKFIGSKGTTFGIIKIKIDGVVVATFDMYNGASQTNQIQTQTGISVASSGVKEIKVGIDGKNALSSNYAAIFSELVFYRTA